MPGAGQHSKVWDLAEEQDERRRGLNPGGLAGSGCRCGQTCCAAPCRV